MGVERLDFEDIVLTKEELRELLRAENKVLIDCGLDIGKALKKAGLFEPEWEGIPGRPTGKYLLTDRGKRYQIWYQSKKAERVKGHRRANIAIIISIAALLINALTNLERILQSFQYLLGLIR